MGGYGSIHGNETSLRVKEREEGIFRRGKLENSSSLFFFSFSFSFSFFLFFFFFLNRDREEESSHDFTAYVPSSFFFPPSGAAFFLIPVLHAPPIRFVSSEIKYTRRAPPLPLVTTPCYLLRLRPRWKCLSRKRMKNLQVSVNKLEVE